jgi:uncharacterized protein YkwD
LYHHAKHVKHAKKKWFEISMYFLRSIFFMVALGISACTTGMAPQLGPDGRPLPKVYRIIEKNQSQVQFQMLDAINAIRTAAANGPLTFDSALNAAAATHSRDMSTQNRPWHFGSDGSSPIVRSQRAGYTGTFLGETISETFETELETLSAWLSQDDTRKVILDPRATDLGFAWYQEQNGKIWWTLLTGAQQTSDWVQG